LRIHRAIEERNSVKAKAATVEHLDYIDRSLRRALKEER
jgi:DNA-binding FadR family transcriptional regulator